jgi:hypothetical protein
MKATALIEQQHREVERLFDSIEAGKANERLVEKLAVALTAHAIIEEQLFYPAVMKVNKELALESYEEHELMAYALKRLVAADVKDEGFHARVKAVKDTTLHHVQEEEREMLPAMAREEEEDESLGQKMEARFRELVDLGYEGALAARKAKRSSDGHRVKAAAGKKRVSHAHRKAA